MTKTGWDIAMRRIVAEFDIPQFMASALVRKIAANHFRLPAADRAKFERLPDEVIGRIEQIVGEAYVDAGEDVGGTILRDDLWQQAVVARRAMIANGELLSLTDFKKQIGLSDKRLAALIDGGTMFTIEVDETSYIPAVFADPAYNRRRLQAICRIIFPAPPMARLDFLTARRGSLGGRSPVELLEDDDDFKRLQRTATAWAAEWSLTTVKAYEGEYETEPDGVAPLYTTSAEIDPRRPLWECASEALQVHGYQWPLGPYPAVQKFTLFVVREKVGDSTPTPEACVQIGVDGECIRVRIVAAPGTTLQLEAVPARQGETFIEVAKRVIAQLCKS